MPVTFRPSESYQEALTRAASMWRIAADYWDIFGNHHTTSEAAQRAILSSLGVPTESKERLDAARDERLWEEWSRLTPATLVISQKSQTIPVNLPSGLAKSPVVFNFQWETGGTDIMEIPEGAYADEAFLRGCSFERRNMPLARELPLGYHTLDASAGGERSRTLLIVAPEHAWIPPALGNGGRTAGIAISLYGLRSQRNWGCGDFTDLEALIVWAATNTGVGFIALNPLHALANRTPFNTSPYLPACTFYRNFIYLDVERVDGFNESPWAKRLLNCSAVQQEIRALRDSALVEYERVDALKRTFLKLAFRAFERQSRDSERARQFNEYVEREGEPLDRYAVYTALDEWMHRKNPNLWIWPDWPEEYRSPDAPGTQAFVKDHPRSVRFYKYVQWQIDQQLAAAQRRAIDAGLPIGLYHDLALATDRCGGDLWAYRRFYVEGCRVGAPPDSFAPEGQDWAFPPPHTERHHEDGYRLYRETIRQNASHGGALRIDHVMRFFRLFWIPDGMKAAEGTYVEDSHEDLLRILALESVRNRFIVIGEDLGTVEPSFRDDLARFGIHSYRLLYFERDPDGRFHRPDQYPRHALVSSTTHDLPTLAGFWIGRDIEARRAAGLVSDDVYQRQFQERARDKQQMLDMLFELGLLPEWSPRSAVEIPELTGELHNAFIGFLAMTPSALMVLNQEDLTKETDQQNLPGSTSEYPNWRRKMQYTIEELHSDPRAHDFARMLRNWLERSGRSVRKTRDGFMTAD